MIDKFEHGSTDVPGDDEHEVCTYCGGTLVDHVQRIEEGPHGEEIYRYNCLRDEIEDLILDMATVEPPTDVGWILTLARLREAYLHHLGGPAQTVDDPGKIEPEIETGYVEDCLTRETRP